MRLFTIIANLRFQDVLDILFLTVVAYHLYLWFWGTKAFKALVGLLALGIVFTVARFGTKVFRIIRDQIDLPNDRVNVVHIEPPQMEFKFRETLSTD